MEKSKGLADTADGEPRVERGTADSAIADETDRTEEDDGAGRSGDERSGQWHGSRSR